jgi:predicted DCC family thiol-disulfide oxidoreductase YuxK
VLAGTGIHLGIFLIQRAPFFQFIFLYVVFVEALRLYGPHRRRSAAPQRPSTIIYDGLCPLCIRTMVILDAADPGGRSAYLDLETNWSAVAIVAPSLTPERARAAMHVITPDGQLLHGFRAFKHLAHRLPWLWPLVPLFHAPLAERAGPWLYDRVAGSRAHAECTVERCAA